MTNEQIRYELYQEAKKHVNPVKFKGGDFVTESIRIAKELEDFVFNKKL